MNQSKWLIWVFGMVLLASFAMAAERLDCQKVVDYQINARLNAASNSVDGSQVLIWRNTSSQPVSDLYFHAYMNAFKNNKSSFLKEALNQASQFLAASAEADYGYLEISALTLGQNDGSQTDLMPTFAFVQPDDGNNDDETVFKVTLPKIVNAGDSVQLNFQFQTRLPRRAPRIGYNGDFFFFGQWFPKIGVLEETGWNCHQNHRFTEYYADYGSYDVRLTVPRGFLVGAVGVRTDSTANNDNTYTVRYQQDCIHDFAWTASPNFHIKTARFTSESLPEVQIKLLLQPEHGKFADDYIRACQAALKYYGLWYGAYPYPQITIIDPVWSSWVGGMEYPTLFTGEISWQMPAAALEPQGITVHEAGHQWWYGMVGNNEVEHAWLDEGFNSYSTSRCQMVAFGNPRATKKYFGVTIAFPEAEIDSRYDRYMEYCASPAMDALNQPSWLSKDRSSYRANAYGKGSLLLWTLEGYLGEDVFARIMREYAIRYRFKHPKPEQFIQVVNELAPQNMDWFFDQVVKSTAVLDYAVGTIANEPVTPARGFFTRDGKPSFQAAATKDDQKKEFISQVTVKRLGTMQIPVEIEVLFENGDKVMETWDGKANWQRFRYQRDQKVASVIIDPERKLWLDVNYQNNSRLAEKRSLASVKWTLKWMTWLQHLMEVFSFYV